MVQRHIKSLLYEYDCVIIPDFGGLITHYAPAKIHPVKHTFSPPSKRIAFNEQLKVNDGLLITTLAHQQQWPVAKAQQAVAEFVMDLKAQLQAKQLFELRGVGVFRYNIERKIIFETTESENFLENSFGLPEIIARPIPGKEPMVLRGNYQDDLATASTSKPQKLRQRLRRLYRIGTTLVLGGLTVSGLYLLSMQTDVALSSLNPFSMLSTSEVSLSEAPKQPSGVTPDTEQLEKDAFDQAYEKEQLKQDSLSGANAVETIIADEVDALEEEKLPQAIETATASVVPDLAEEVPSSTPAKVSSSKASAQAKKVAAEEEKIVKDRTGRYYVIMGVFEKAPYATLNQKRLSKEGYSAKTLVPSRVSKLYKVSVADFANAEEAQTALNSLREKTGQDLWVLNY